MSKRKNNLDNVCLDEQQKIKDESAILNDMWDPVTYDIAECHVCSEELCRSVVEIEDCRHSFHETCLKGIKKCPICRSDIRKFVYVTVYEWEPFIWPYPDPEHWYYASGIFYEYQPIPDDDMIRYEKFKNVRETKESFNAAVVLSLLSVSVKYQLKIPITWTFWEIKELASVMTTISASQIRLVCKGYSMPDTEKLSDVYENDIIIHVILQLTGS